MPTTALTGCSSLRDKFRTSTYQLANVLSCHRRLYASGNIWNDFESWYKLILGFAVGMQLISTHLAGHKSQQ
eukprot:5441606-Pleurochrysis_carterae.AAC.4